MQGASKAKRRRILEAAEAEAEEVAELQAVRSKANETRVNPDDLVGGCGLMLKCSFALLGGQRWSEEDGFPLTLRLKLLPGRHKRRKDKAERLESVMAGREGREKYGSSISRKKQKTGGLTEREKQKRKSMPMAARVHQVQKRTIFAKKLRACKKNFKGHAGGGA